MITATDYQCYASADCHAAKGAVVRQIQCYFQGLGGRKGYASFHRAVRYACFTGQDGAVGGKGNEIQAFQLVSDKLLVFRQLNDVTHLFRVPVFIHKDISDASGQKIKQDFDELSRIYRSSKSREADFKAGGDSGSGTFTGRAGENLLSRSACSDQSAFAGAFCFKIKSCNFLAETTQQIILQCRFLPLAVIISFGKCVDLMWDKYADLGGGGKGIPLNMVYRQDVVFKIIGTLNRFISGVAFMVDGFQQSF